MKPIAIGSDDAGAGLRHAIVEHLREQGYEVKDFGVDDASKAYPTVAFDVAEDVAAGAHDRAILCCGTGIGMAIAANKVRGVYAANCHDVYSAQRARKSNNAQVLTLGGRVVGTQLALTIVDAWMESEFEGGRSEGKLAEIVRHEQRLNAVALDASR